VSANVTGGLGFPNGQTCDKELVTQRRDTEWAQMDLSNRDIAFLLWFAVAAIALLAWPPGRAGVLGTLRLLRGKLLLVALLYAAYFALVVAGGQALGIWNTSLLKETLAWFVLAGIPLLTKFPETYKSPGFYRRSAGRLFGIAVAIEFLVGLTALSLGAELLLLPAAVILTLLSAVAATKPEYRQIKRLFDGALVVLGLVVIALTAMKLIEIAPTLDPTQLGLLLFLPIWATFFTLLFVGVFGLYANYEPKIGEINRTRPESRRARWRAKLALLTAFGARNLELGRFAPFDARELAQTTSWTEARRYVTYKRAEIRHKVATEELTARRLARYTGVAGDDWDGQPLDQREFVETRLALDYLHTFHEAQFRDGRYRDDLLTMVHGLLSKTFPEDEITITIARNGKSWFAWRRTVTGWVIGVGAAGPPPDRWSWEGREPPTEPPRPGSDWKRPTLLKAMRPRSHVALLAPMTPRWMMPTSQSARVGSSSCARP
jgi:hypothetical protein